MNVNHPEGLARMYKRAYFYGSIHEMQATKERFLNAIFRLSRQGFPVWIGPGAIEHRTAIEAINAWLAEVTA